MRRILPLLLSVIVLCAQSAGLLHGIDHAAAGHGSAQAAAALSKAGGQQVLATTQPAARSNAVVAAPLQALGDTHPLPGSVEHRCDKCYQYAQFSSGVTPQPPALVFARSVHTRTGATQAARAARDTPALRSRGPPLAA